MGKKNSFLFLHALIGITNIQPTLKFKEIRQLPDTNQVHRFIDQVSFNSLKKPNIYFIFFDSLRPDFALRQGNRMHSFFERNFSVVDSYAAGTATIYSMYSFFQSLPAFLAYSSVPNLRGNPNDYGSIYLKVLDKLGYKKNIYGYYWYCTRNHTEKGTAWERFLEAFFGWNTRLLERCKTASNYDQIFFGNQDELTVEELERKLPTVITSPHGNFSFFNFYNNHTPYKWGSVPHLASTEIGVSQNYRNPVHIKNRYANSVLGSDANFDRLMRLIETLPGYKDAIIVLFSDHGEMLYEKDNEIGHGGIPFQEKIKTVLSFQFGEHSLYGGKSNDSSASLASLASLATMADIFPTIFDYMEVFPGLPKSWVVGKSLLSEKRQSSLVVAAKNVMPTKDMVFVNKTQKAWIEVEDEDFYHSRAFKLTKVTDLEDRLLPLEDHPCFDKSENECKEVIKAQFPEAIEELYP